MQLSTGEFRATRVVEIRVETPDVKTFVLADDAPYKPGQFLTILSPEGKERRSYSFSTSPEFDTQAAITVKRVTNGFVSRYLIDHVKVGDIVSISGPFGFFTLPEQVDGFKQVVFLAAGIGVTPILSLLKELLARQPKIPTTLIYSNSSVESTVFYEDLQKLQQQYAEQLRVEFLFSNSRDLARARLNKQLLPELLHEHLKTGKNDTFFYLCGPFPYMRMVQLALEEENIPADHIRKENFNTAVITQQHQPPDKDTHVVSLNFKGGYYKFDSTYPDTILAAAKRSGLNLPYSCENGICGSCAAHCTSGKVWHRNNEVLTEAELKLGLILTCTGYPIEGNIELTIK